MASINFNHLPPEYQHLLVLAKEKYNLDVVPLQELNGGRTGAYVYLVSVSTGDQQQIQHLVVKFDHVNEKARQTEIERHHQAVSQAPASFAGQHMAELAYEVEDQGAVALFYSIAGQSLQNYRTLASIESQRMLEELFRATNNHLLNGWNSGASFQQALLPQKLLEKWLGYRLKPEGQIGSFIKATFAIDPHTEGFVIQGQIYPNPLEYGINADHWSTARALDVLTGFQHGDLNIGNILAMFAPESGEILGYFLIDFALYKPDMPLLYDQRYLELSYLIRELERVPVNKWVDFITTFTNTDIPNPRDVPVEMASACTVINAGREAYQKWIQEAHPSLSDDLWGQFWLAGVAVGLNFCNKNVLSTEERLAALIYSSAHLKRYCKQFGIPSPVDVRLLYEANQWRANPLEEISATAHIPQHKDLPAQLTPFIGRVEELKSVTDLLLRENIRLLTLTGPGGTGKTRLALQAASELQDSFDDGVFFIDLAPVRDPKSVLPAIARAIGLREISDQPLVLLLKQYLQAQRVMLLLDNFEQVTAAALDIAELIRDCPQLKLEVTSREALSIRGEHVYPVSPLELPDVESRQATLDQLAQAESIQLFIDRAQAVEPEFQLTEENAPSIVELCVRLDGLPLAIELATARIGLFTPQDLLNRVGSRLKLSGSGARDMPERQQTLRRTIDWSYELLGAGEQRLFELLSVFSGSTIEAAEGVVSLIKFSEDINLDVLDGLTSLVAKNLVRKVDLPSGFTKLAMLETIREYACERLEENPDFSQAVRLAHATYFANFSQSQWEHPVGDGREAVIERLEADIENLQIAWNYWVRQGNLEQLRKLSDSLWLIYDARGWYHATVELSNDLLKVLSLAPSTPEILLEKILLQTSLARALMAVKGYTPEVETAYNHALQMAQSSDQGSQMFPVLRALYSFYTFRGEFEKGLSIGRQILELAEHNNDSYMRVAGYFVLGSSLAFTGDNQTGLENLDKGISNIDRHWHPSRRFLLGNYPGVSCYTASSILLWGLGYPDKAIQRANAAVDLAKEINHPYSLAYALFHNGYLRYWMRDVAQSLEYAQAVLEVAEKHKFQIWSAVGNCLQGAALAGVGRPGEGMVIIQHGMDLYQGLKSPPIFWPILRSLQAKVCGQAGKPEQGLTYIEESIAIPTHGYGKVLLAEFFQIKGNLLLMRSPDSPSTAEPWFRQALETAQEQGASMLELRAAISLVRVWRDMGKVTQARQLLIEAYQKLNEGFSTVDLKEARSLLDQMSETKPAS
jgi:predicted ATPase